jgi:hypothetical protein
MCAGMQQSLCLGSRAAAVLWSLCWLLVRVFLYMQPTMSLQVQQLNSLLEVVLVCISAACTSEMLLLSVLTLLA